MLKLNIMPISKENIVLRSGVDPRAVYVIPNAVVASSFLPDPTQAPPVKEKSEAAELPLAFLC